MIILLILLTLIMAFAGGCANRAGGSGHYPRQAREIGVPLACTLLLLTLWHPVSLLGWLMIVLSFGLMIGAVSTYDYWFPKPPNFSPAYYGLWGLMIGLSFIPLVSAGLQWYGIMLRAGLLVVILDLWDRYMNRSVTIWKWTWTSDIVQEFMRGAFIVITIPLILI